MSKWWNDPEIAGGSYLSAKVGEKVTFTIAKIERDIKAKFPFKKKDGTNLGWALKFTTTGDQEFMCNTWSLLKLLREHKVDVGDKIEIRHPIDKVWELSVLSREKSANEEEIDIMDLGKEYPDNGLQG